MPQEVTFVLGVAVQREMELKVKREEGGREAEKLIILQNPSTLDKPIKISFSSSLCLYSTDQLR